MSDRTYLTAHAAWRAYCTLCDRVVFRWHRHRAEEAS